MGESLNILIEKYVTPHLYTSSKFKIHNAKMYKDLDFPEVILDILIQRRI